MTASPASGGVPSSRPSVTEAVAMIEAGFDALTTAQIEALPVGARADAVLAADRAVRWAEAHRLQVLAVFDARGDAALDGARSTAAWLRWRTNTNPGEANRQVKTARRVTELPQMVAAHRAGEISAAHLDVVTRKLDDSPARAETITRAERTFLATARRASPQELARVVRRWVDTVDPLGAVAREGEQQHQRNVTVSSTFAGAVHLSGLLPPEAGALIKTALNGLCSELYAADRAAEKAAIASGSFDVANDLRPTPAQRRADALTELCRRYLNGGYAPKSGGARPHLSVMVDAKTLESDGNEPGLAPAELVGVGPISTAGTQRIGCDAAVTIYGLDATGRPMSYGRTQRVVPPGLRRYLAARDQGCVFPGCGRPEAWTEAHHLVFWSHGGKTDANNLALICVGHHHALHEGGFTTRGSQRPGRSASTDPTAPHCPTTQPCPHRELPPTAQPCPHRERSRLPTSACELSHLGFQHELRSVEPTSVRRLDVRRSRTGGANGCRPR
jgi:hypothetical protein